MKNTHIEHPEDSILNGDLSVLDWFTAKSDSISVKLDGSPAIVWGRNPANGKHFVGTKSVFNKKLIKINHDHAEIDRNHQGKVATILHHCFDNLPTTDCIFQGDFIGLGGSDFYTPNTITYVFPEIVTSNIIIAPHTQYFAEKDLRDAVAKPLEEFDKFLHFDDDENVTWLNPPTLLDEYGVEEDLKDKCNFAKQIATLCNFPKTKKHIAEIKKDINSYIRVGLELDDHALSAISDDMNCDINVLRLWKLVESIKMEMFEYIGTDLSVECYIMGENVGHEGYVMSNKFGTFKIVNRKIFSYANFAISRSRV